MILTSCSSWNQTEKAPITTTVYLYPNKVATPKLPTLEKYDTRYGLDETNNFRKFQRNTLLMTDYIINLQSTIKYYETEITRYQQLQTAKTEQISK